MKLAWVMCLGLAAIAVANAREEKKPALKKPSSVNKATNAVAKKDREKKSSAEEDAKEKKPEDSALEALLIAKPKYVERRPDSFLNDPQGLLGVGEREERSAFLNYHAGDSAIDLYVYLYQTDQEIPKDWYDAGWVDKIFNRDRQAVVVFYHVGKPQRSEMRVTRKLAEKVSLPERNRAIENAVMQALKKTDNAGQLEAFLVQMSIRIYWMERIMRGEHQDGSTVSAQDKPTALKSEAKGHEKIRLLWEKISPFVTPAVVTLVSVLMFWMAVIIARRRARYRFPEFEVEPRLGGPHAAGVGAVISFGRAAPSPAFQREQLPEYLRRM
jgi:hypothetical protein